MDFAFSEEQEMLRGQARSFLAEKSSADRVAELAVSGEGWDPGLWPQVAELGWIGLSVPEGKGGAGFGFLEEAVLFEEMGYALYPGPYFATVGLALPALADADVLGSVIAGEFPATLAYAERPGPSLFYDLDNVGTRAEKANGTWTLSGEKHLVPDAQVGGCAVVIARTSEGVALFLVRITDQICENKTTVDTTRRMSRLALDGVDAQLLVGPEESARLLERIRLRALAALSLEAVGIAQRVLELAIEHSKERRQFEKPIGAYQAVSHQVSNIYMETELARSLAYWAAWCVAEEDDQASVAVAAAKSAAGEAAVAACERAIQVHGGIGFTWEHILHRYYKRAQWIDSFEGFGALQRKVIAERLFG